MSKDLFGKHVKLLKAWPVGTRLRTAGTNEIVTVKEHGKYTAERSYGGEYRHSYSDNTQTQHWTDIEKPYAFVICPDHERTGISVTEYDKQIGRASFKWKCPKCGKTSLFDDLFFEDGC